MSVVVQHSQVTQDALLICGFLEVRDALYLLGRWDDAVLVDDVSEKFETFGAQGSVHLLSVTIFVIYHFICDSVTIVLLHGNNTIVTLSQIK